MLRHKARPGNAVSVEKNQIVGRSQTGSEVASLRSGKAHVRMPDMANRASEGRAGSEQHGHLVGPRAIVGYHHLVIFTTLT